MKYTNEFQKKPLFILIWMIILVLLIGGPWILIKTLF